MSTDPWDFGGEEEEQSTRFYTSAELAAGEPAATRTFSSAEHARLMVEARAAAEVPVVPAATVPPARPTRPPTPPPLPTMRAAAAPDAGPQDRTRVVPAMRSARATAAVVESLAAVQAAQGHLRECGLVSPDLGVAEQLLFGVLENAHVRGWAP